MLTGTFCNHFINEYESRHRRVYQLFTTSSFLRALCLDLNLGHDKFFCLIKELPQESSRFARVDRTYMRTMKKAVEVRNVMQVNHRPSSFHFNRV